MRRMRTYSRQSCGVIAPLPNPSLTVQNNERSLFETTKHHYRHRSTPLKHWEFFYLLDDLKHDTANPLCYIPENCLIT